ncbi:MAG: hypothetical protein Q9221_008947 [Calogaya cf. arnoldii]
MYFPTTFTIAAIAVLSYTPSTSAQPQRSTTTITDDDSNTSCQVDISRSTTRYPANATGSVTQPGYLPPYGSRIPAGNWTWSTNVSVRADNATWQSFALDTATLRGIPEKNVAFHVCVNVFSSIPRETYISTGQNDPGDCSSIFDRPCIDAMKRIAMEAGPEDGDCNALDRKLAFEEPEECKNAFGASSRGMGYIEDGDDAPLPTCGGDRTDSTTHQFSAISKTPNNRGIFNQTDYDEVIHRVVPFLTTIVGDDKSVQANFVCVRAKDVVEGSRVPPQLAQLPTNKAKNVNGSDPQPGKGASGTADSSAVLGRGTLSVGGVLAVVGLLNMVFG